MPVHVEKRGNRYRVVEPSGRIAKTGKGNPRDGGGHSSKVKANAQVRAINSKRRSLGEAIAQWGFELSEKYK